MCLAFLYKDFVVVLISLRSMWFLKVMLTDDELKMNSYLAQFLCFSLFSMTFTLLILINIISAIKFYMNKAMVLDPPMPWGANEKIGMMCIRIGITIVVVGYPLVLFTIGLYPKTYYLFIKEDNDQVNNASRIGLYLGPLAVLISSFVVTRLGARFHQNTGEQQIDQVIPKQMSYFSWLCVTLLGVLICIVISSEVGITSVLRWKIAQLLISVIQLSVPSAVVMNVENLKSYFKSFVKNRLDDAFFLNIYVVPLCLCFAMYLVLYCLYNIVGI